MSKFAALEKYTRVQAHCWMTFMHTAAQTSKIQIVTQARASVSKQVLGLEEYLKGRNTCSFRAREAHR